MDKEIHKENWIVSIIKHGKWYLLSSVFTKGINIALMPIYTRYLTPTDYGILNSLLSVGTLLPVFISLYLDSAFGRFYYEKKNDHEKLQEMFSTVYWFITIYGSVVVICALLLAKFWLPGLLKIPVWPYAFLAFIPALFLQIGQIGMVYLRASLQAKQTTIIEISTIIITTVITLPLLINMHLGVIARLLGSAGAAIFLFIFYTRYFINNDLLVFKFEIPLLKKCLLYSVPLLPNIAGGWIAQFSDRLVIAKYSTLAAVGLYSIGANVAQVLYMVQDSITQVTGPVSMSGLVSDKEATKKKIAKFSLLLLGFMLLAHFGMVLFAQELILVFATHAYSGAYKALAIIAIIYVISSQYRIFSDIISFHNQTWVFSSAGIMMAIVNLCLNIIFVPKFGYVASAIVTVVSMSLYTGWLFFWSQHFDKINYFWKRSIILIIIYGIFISFSFFYLLKEVSIVFIAIKFLVFLAAICSIAATIFWGRGFGWAQINEA